LKVKGYQKFQQNQQVSKYLTHIGLIMVIFGEVAFSEYAPEKSTNWTIFYFVFWHSGALLISLNEALKSFDKYTMYVSFVFCGFFITMIVNLLLKINMDYDLFLKSVNDTFIDAVRYLLLGVTGIILSLPKIIKLWQKATGSSK